MKQPTKTKKKDPEETSGKKGNKKPMLILAVVLLAAFLLIWFGREYLASKSLISKAAVTLKGRERSIVFSQKTSANTSKERMQEVEPVGPAHYGYFLELLDKNSNTPLDELKFTSPVDQINHTPEMILYPNGDVWIVSTTRSYERESPGFVLKFSVRDDKISEVDFKLDDHYRVREVKENKVMLSKGTDTYSSHSFGSQPIYLDLETSQIVEGRKSNQH